MGKSYDDTTNILAITMSLSQIFKLIVYLGLLAGGLVFVKTSFEDYVSGHTSYSKTVEPLSLADLPAIVICFSFDPRRLR